ncbi:MAG: hypothetical protein KDC05_15940, partial [Bacteroidales bacterium]|nr:hypothetical protein [Bacteroidales bacterium]
INSLVHLQPEQQIMRSLILTFLLSVLISVGFSQHNVTDTSLSIPMFYASYAYQVPGGDMADRFGANSNIGGGFKWKLASNWMIGADFSYVFGNTINDEAQLMSNLKTETGHIIDLSGGFTQFDLYERGYFVSANVGKLFPVLSPNPNSGFFVSASAGYFQHKIRIDVLNNTAPQLWDDYKKGYDRYTAGIGVSEFIGYMYLSNSRLLNFYGGFEFMQAWTSPRRDVNFDTMEPDPVQERFDVLNGFRIGWIIPIFQRQPQALYFN